LTSVFLPILWLVLAIILLLVLNVYFKISSLLGLIVTAILLGSLEGLPVDKLIVSLRTGLGSTLGALALIIALGAVLGKLIADSGASHQIARTMVSKLGPRKSQWAIMLVGAIFGFAMFYEVAFLVLAPLVISVAAEAKVPYMRLAIGGVAAATTAHSLFPPQPGPMALVTAYHANIGEVYWMALVVAIPSIVLSGYVLPKFLGNLDFPVPELLKGSELDDRPARALPSFRISVLIPVLPAIIIGLSMLSGFLLDKTTLLYRTISFVGTGEISLLITVFVAIYAFNIRRGQGMQEAMKSLTHAVETIALVIMVIGAGGMFRQVILDSGLGTHIATVMRHTTFSPIIMAWVITVFLRLATGAGTVSAITAAGIVGPLIPEFHINPAIMVLATATASNTITHTNDASFWLFKEYFGLSIKDTFRTWGLLELCNSIVGLIVVLILNMFVH
jgi:high-affinity gluconate transporter